MLNVIHPAATPMDRRLRAIGDDAMDRMRTLVARVEYSYTISYAADHFRQDLHWRAVPHALVVAFDDNDEPVAWYATEFLIKPRSTHHAVYGDISNDYRATTARSVALEYERRVVASDHPTVRAYTYDPYKGIYTECE